MKQKKSIEELDNLIKKFDNLAQRYPLSDIYKETVVQLKNERDKKASEIGRKK